MSSDKVTVACNLPQGMVCEVGLELDYHERCYKRTPAYRRVVLKGRTHATTIALPKGTPYISARDLPPGLTEGVDREFITEWLRQHKNMARHIWIVEAAADLKHQHADNPNILEPMEPKKQKVGGIEIGTYDPNSL
jgi:hypothetical protein